MEVNFNSTMVRLIDIDTILDIAESFVFQFHYGAINRYTLRQKQR